MDWRFGGRSVQIILLYLLITWGVNAIYAVRILNVKKFGAVSNGRTDSSQAFLRAWEKACNLEGRFKILVPNGVFLVKPLVFQGPCKGLMVMQINGILKAPKDLRFFHDDDWIKFEHINGLFISGGGVFDGQGALAWPHNKCPERKDCRLLPATLKLAHVTSATIQSMTSTDSKSFHMIIFESHGIRLDDIKIKAPETSPNTDGIHIEGSSDVNITRSVIGTGDDCISVGPGNKRVSIFKVFCGPGHGISVGSLGKYPGEDGVFGLRVRNCTLTGTTNGVRVKTWQASPRSLASDFVFEDIMMKDVYNPIIIDQKYCPYSSCDEKFPSMVKLSKIKFRNIRGTSTSMVAVKLLCSKAVPCEDVELRDINLEYTKKGVPALASCSNVVHGSSKGLVIPPPCI